MADLESTDPSAGKSFLSAVDRVLYPITLGFTLVILGMQLYEFFKGGAYVPRYPVGDVYLTLLAAYAAQREGVKWLGVDEATLRIRRGELFVGVWFALFLALWAVGNLSMRVVLPQELKTITLGVLGIFAATGVSSGLRSRSERGDSKTTETDRRVQILRLLSEKGSLSSRDTATTLQIPGTTAWRILESLVTEGLVVQSDGVDKRDRRYSLKS